MRPGTSIGFGHAAYRQFAWPDRLSMLRGRRFQGPQGNYAGSRSCCQHGFCRRQMIEKIPNKQESQTADKQIARVSSYPPYSRADTSSVRAFQAARHSVIGFVCLQYCEQKGNAARLRRSFMPRYLVSTYRSEEHTSELQSHSDLVCRLLLEKK